jgi:hypothetical protein
MVSDNSNVHFVDNIFDAMVRPAHIIDEYELLLFSMLHCSILLTGDRVTRCKLLGFKEENVYTLYYKYPIFKDLYNNDSLIRAYIYHWATGSKTIEEGLVELIKYLKNDKDLVREELEKTMQNGVNVICKCKYKEEFGGEWIE